MTGLAQVHGLRDRSSSEEKTKLDLQYLMHRSLLIDLSLLLQTAWTLTMRLIRGPKNIVPITNSVSADSNLDSKEVIFSAHRSQPGTD